MAMRDDLSLPQLPQNPDFGSVMKMLSSIDILPRLRESIQPELSGLMGEGGPILAPQLAAIRQGTAQNVAAAQSDAMMRGLTGSDIEAAGMRGERAAGLSAEAGLRGQMGQTLLDLIFKATQGDLEAATQLRQLLAGAMGEELTAQRDIDMFNRQLQEMGAQESRNRKAGLINSIIGAVGGGATAWLGRKK